MRLKTKQILFGINILTLILVLIILFFPNNVLRIILGLPLVLFFPGYTLLAALFPRQGSLNDIERFALSFGMSIAIVPLLGLGLNYSPWGIRLYPILITLFVFILAMSLIAGLRGRRLPPEESVSWSLEFKLPSLSPLWSGQSRRDKIISLVLGVMVIGAVGALVYVIQQPRSEEKFTEFYVLNAEGKAENYPNTVILGQSAEVILGIINHESAVTVYRIEIVIDGEKTGEAGPVSLEAEEKWEQKVTFTPDHTGTNQKVEFLLYKNSATEAQENLHLWVEVQ